MLTNWFLELYVPEFQEGPETKEFPIFLPLKTFFSDK